MIKSAENIKAEKMIEKLYKPLRVDSPNAKTLKTFLEWAAKYKLSPYQINQALRQFGICFADDNIMPLIGGGATPVVMTDATTALNAANLNKYLNVGNADKANCKILYGQLYWSAGTTFVVSVSKDSSGIVDADLAWSVDTLNISHTGEFTNSPLCLLAIVGTGLIPTWSGSTINTTPIQWRDYAGVLITTLSSSFSAIVTIIGV